MHPQYLLLVVMAVCCSCSEPEAPASSKSDVQKTLRFEGICDGSAVARIGDDHLLVAYDEQNSLYLFANSGGPVLQEFPYSRLLELEDDAEVDLEAAAGVGEAIWWIGSHGLKGDATDAPNRRVLFRTSSPQATATQLQLEWGPVDILPHLLKSDFNRKHLSESVLTLGPKDGGLSIEGLAIKTDGDLLVGLRSPLSSGQSGDALVFQVAVSGNEVSAGEMYRIDLNNRGVRDMLATGDGYLIIAGSASGGGEFALYLWRVGEPAELLAIVPEGVNAEAIAGYKDHWLVLSDDGKKRRPDRDAKDGDRRCDRVFKKNPQHGGHESVFFSAVKIAR